MACTPFSALEELTVKNKGLFFALLSAMFLLFFCPAQEKPATLTCCASFSEARLASGPEVTWTTDTFYTQTGNRQNDKTVYDQAPVDWAAYEKLWLKDLPRATPDEPLLAAYSENKAKDFLDDTSLKWARQNRCATCHTTVAYLMARPLVGQSDDRAAWNEVRETVKNFANEGISRKAPLAPFIVGATVAALTVGDTLSGRELQPDTRALFDFMWASQGADGAWVIPQNAGNLPFLERDPHYLAFMVALAVGYAPGRYYEDPRARAGFAKLQGFIRNNLPSNAHDKAVLLWASVRTPGLLNAQERSEYVRSLLALQKEDGGWALPSLGTWPRHDGAANDPQGDSDGYATSLAALALCQQGYSAKDPAVRRAVTWIEQHQRASGRWYTRSLYSDRFQNYLSNMGTAYAVMALSSCRATAR
jgi:squalene-hopene/tetraprenyl-beta-curcumene cyclase